MARADLGSPGRTGRSKNKKRVIQAHAAGIDLGARSHYVALPPDRGEPVRCFEPFTQDLVEMADWLVLHGVKTVAMEATGVYWIPVYQVLERAGLEVQLVNARHYSNVPGRKTDVSDCQWLQHLHECGLVRGSFRPEDAICVVRSYTRQRDTWVEESSRHVLRMQKALEQMNVQLHKVVSNVMGKTGQGIIKAILDGERNPEVLARLRDRRCRKSEEEICRALRGDWREEHLFCLRQSHEAYEFVQARIAECEQTALATWQAMASKSSDGESPGGNGAPGQDIAQELIRLTGVDLFAVEGLGPGLVPKLLAETGLDMSAWPTEKHFASWAGLCPPNRITGGRRFRVGRPAKRSRVAQLFKMAAQGVANSKTPLCQESCRIS